MRKISADDPIRLNHYYITLDAVSLNEDDLKSFIILRDVSERKSAADLLKSSEEKYRNLIEKSDDIIWIVDLDLHTVYVSHAIEKKLGFTIEERKQQALDAQITPSSYTRLLELISQELALEQKGCADPDRTTKVEVEYYHKDGSTRWFENIFSGLRDNAGTLIGAQGVSRDITDRKNAEMALLQERDKLQAAIAKIKTLSGMLPICSHCKKIRDDNGYWNQIETYIRDHSEAEFSHSICQECAKKYYLDLDLSHDDESHD